MDTLSSTSMADGMHCGARVAAVKQRAQNRRVRSGANLDLRTRLLRLVQHDRHLAPLIHATGRRQEGRVRRASRHALHLFVHAFTQITQIRDCGTPPCRCCTRQSVAALEQLRDHTHRHRGRSCPRLRYWPSRPRLAEAQKRSSFCFQRRSISCQPRVPKARLCSRARSHTSTHATASTL